MKHSPEMVCPGVLGVGPSNADTMIIGIAPGKDEIRTGIPFTGPAGQLLNGCLKAMGIEREQCFVTNLLCWWNNAPDPADIAGCWPRLAQQIAHVDPKVIITLGQIPAESLTGLPYSKVRHIPQWVRDRWLISTWHPAVVLHSSNEDMVVDILRDLRKVPLYSGKTPEDFAVEYDVITAPSRARKLFAQIGDQKASLDVEYDMTEKKLVCLSITLGTATLGGCERDHTYVLTRSALDGIKAEDWPTQAKWIYQYGMYDQRMIAREWNVWLPIVEDTLLQAYTVDGRSGGGGEEDTYKVGIHGLKRLAGEFCGAGTYNIDTQDAIRNERWSELWDYNAKDAAYTFRLHHYFSEWQRDENVEGIYRDLLIPAANALSEIQEHGAYISTEVIGQLVVEWGKLWLLKEQEIIDYAAAQGHENLNPRSHPQLNKFLYDTLGIRPTQFGRVTHKKALELISHPFIEMLQEYRRVDKMLGTYVIGIDRELDENNRVHPSPQLHGTRTGRLTYNDPPIQTIPQEFRVGPEYSKIRSLFAAPPGFKIFAADYEQAELWMMTMYSGDQQMLADLRTGDFHSNAAETMFKMDRNSVPPMEWKRYRNDSKYVTFGVAYDRQAKALHENELKAYSLEECRQFVKEWYNRYWQYREWTERTRQQIRDTGEFVCLSGRKFRFPVVLSFDSLRKAVNYPIQSGAHDNLLASMVDLHPVLKKMGAWIWFDIHDALVGEYPENMESEVCAAIKYYTELPRFGVSYGIPMEIKIGPDWLNTTKWSGK